VECCRGEAHDVRALCDSKHGEHDRANLIDAGVGEYGQPPKLELVADKRGIVYRVQRVARGAAAGTVLPPRQAPMISSMPQPHSVPERSMKILSESHLSVRERTLGAPATSWAMSGPGTSSRGRLSRISCRNLPFVHSS
jgi:hypothetical protein